MEAKLGKTASQSSLSDEEDISLAGESSLMPHLPFYKIVKDGNLSQGDILPNCEIVIPIVRAIDQGSLGTSGVKKSPAFSYLSEVVIMSQSCDFEAGQDYACGAMPCTKLNGHFRSYLGKGIPRKQEEPSQTGKYSQSNQKQNRKYCERQRAWKIPP